ncbi:MAG: hypothetical protein HKO08_02620 [Erythrobacter sp.]|nr:hypothetical protein [Erythrobacter sp.]
MTLFVAGQSNVRSLYQSPLLQFLQVRTGRIEEVWHGGTSLAPDENHLDWYPVEDENAETGEMFEEFLNLIEQSPDGLTGLIWVHGERDRTDPDWAASYEANLTAFIERVIEIAGPIPIVIVPMSTQAEGPIRRPETAEGWQIVIDAQNAVAQAFDNVFLVDPDVVAADHGISADEMFRDPLHYTYEFASLLVDAAMPYFSDHSVDQATGHHMGDFSANTIFTGVEDDIIFAGGGSDRVYASFGDDIVYGGFGYDILSGAGGSDKILGEEGDDILDGGLGDDALDGGEGIDIASYLSAPAAVEVDLGQQGIAQDTLGAGFDILVSIEGLEGSNFGDTLLGSIQVDRILGGNGDDLIRGNGGNDILDGGSGNDRLFGGDGWDTIHGGGWTDNIHGESGDDHLFGGYGSDRIHGGKGNDILDGGVGDDILLGSWGVDEMTGGAGSDTFVFESEKETGRFYDSADVITDFKRWEGDLIDLSAIDAIAGTPEDDPFQFIGSDRFSGAAGELRYFRKDGDTFLAADLDGDGLADMYIQLKGDMYPNLSDFIL